MVHGQTVPKGAAIYVQLCQRCHGPDGSRARFEAKNLRSSTMPDSAIIKQVKYGRRVMPGFRKLSPDDMPGLISYVKNLRRP